MELSEQIQELISALRASVDPFMERFPRYQLDLQWPSMGLLNVILDDTKKRYLSKDSFSKSSADVSLRQTSAYLALFAAECWNSFCPPNAVTVNLGAENDIILKASRGPYLEGLTFEVNVTQALKTVLFSKDTMLNCFAQYVEPATAHTDRVSAFALGLVTGLTPFGNGKWSSVAPADWAAPLTLVQRSLAVSTALHFSRVTPTDPVLTLPLTFERHLTLPPPGYEETYPFCRSALSFLETMKMFDVPKERQRASCLNLAFSSNPLLRGTGAVTALSMTDTPNDLSLKNVMWSWPEDSHWLYPAYSAARQALGKVGSFVEALKQGEPSEAIRLFTSEQSYRLHPLLRLPMELIADPALITLCQSLTTLDFTAALDAIEELSRAQHPSLPYLPLIQADLLQRCSSIDLATKLLRALPEERYLKSPAAADYLDLVAHTFEIEGNLEQSVRLLYESLHLRARSRSLFEELAVRYVTQLVKLQRLEPIYEFIDSLSNHRVLPFPAQAIKVSLTSLDSGLPVTEELQELARKSPPNPLLYSIISRASLCEIMEQQNTKLPESQTEPEK